MHINVLDLTPVDPRVPLSGERPVVVHPFYLGYDKAEALQVIESDRVAIDSGLGGCTFSNTVANEAENYLAYLAALRERLQRFSCATGILVEAQASVERTLAALETIKPGMDWIVIPTASRDNTRLAQGRDWSVTTLTLGSCGLASAVVFGASDGHPDTCVPTIARLLKEAGIAAVVERDASFRFRGKAE